ncbi:MAG: hypothetical protein PHF60_02455 [Candidatus ainarchaeum sp.]|nr:hypothetical protein [Candidatus ainarchaeum sp.]
MAYESLFGIAAGAIGFLGFVPYIIGTLRGTTKPNKTTWLIWAVMGVIIAASYFSAGARDSVWVPAAYAIGILAVAALSLRFGEKGWTKLDLLCLLGAGVGLLLWWLTSEPTFALYLTIAVDAIGFLPTLRKAYERPESEDRLAWCLFLVADALNIFAISEWTLAMASYPVYVLVFTIAVNALLHLPKRDGTRGKGRKGRVA